MSGHSKWSQIKRQKGVADAKRGQAFTKQGKAISIAVRSGGGVTDPNQNFRLRLEVEKARGINMPKENIARAIERGVGSGDKGELSEVVYEGFAPHGIAMLVEAVTDNKMRTTPEIKSLFDKNGGTLGIPGSVAYQFTQMGMIIIAKKEQSFDTIFSLAVDAGASDVEEVGEEVYIYTAPVDLARAKNALKDLLPIVSAELIRRSVTPVVLTEASIVEKVMNFIERIENHDDVQKVYAAI